METPSSNNSLVCSNSCPTSLSQQSFIYAVPLDSGYGTLSVNITPQDTILNQTNWCHSIARQLQRGNPAGLTEQLAQQIHALVSPEKLSVKLEYKNNDGAVITSSCKYPGKKKRKSPAVEDEEEEDVV